MKKSMANWKIMVVLANIIFEISTPLPITEEQKSMLVDKLNFYRRQVGSSNMRIVTWDENLETNAKNYATECKYPTHDTTENGENMYASTTSSLKDSIEVATEVWFNETSNYNYDAQNCDSTCRNYLQVVWASNYKIGCGVSTCPGKTGLLGGSAFLLIICRYNEKAVVTGATRPFEKGTPCTACSSSDDYCQESLCANVDRDGVDFRPEITTTASETSASNKSTASTTASINEPTTSTTTTKPSSTSTTTITVTTTKTTEEPTTTTSTTTNSVTTTKTAEEPTTTTSTIPATTSTMTTKPTSTPTATTTVTTTKTTEEPTTTTAKPISTSTNTVTTNKTAEEPTTTTSTIPATTSTMTTKLSSTSTETTTVTTTKTTEEPTTTTATRPISTTTRISTATTTKATKEPTTTTFTVIQTKTPEPTTTTHGQTATTRTTTIPQSESGSTTTKPTSHETTTPTTTKFDFTTTTVLTTTTTSSTSSPTSSPTTTTLTTTTTSINPCGTQNYPNGRRFLFDNSLCVSHYYECVHGNYIQRHCAAGTRFDIISTTCVWPTYIAACGGRTTTTTAQTTTSTPYTSPATTKEPSTTSTPPDLDSCTEEKRKYVDMFRKWQNDMDEWTASFDNHVPCP